MSILHNIFFFVIAIGVLVAFHEFGHYWVARKMGVKVLRFSIGFGKPLFTWKRTIGTDTIEYVLAAIPLGGYVKMLDEREGNVADADKHRAFNNQPLYSRTAIVAAGPIFNFILAIFFYWFVYISGVSVDRPLLGEAVTGSKADQAGFEVHDEVTKVGSVEVLSWSEFRIAVLDQGLDGGSIDIQVRDINGFETTHSLDLGTMRLLENDGDVIANIGFRQWWPELPPEIGGVLEKGAAEQAGLQKGDLIVAINDEPVTQWKQIVEIVQQNPKTTLQFLVQREGQQQNVPVTPAARETDGTQTGFIGAYQHVPKALRDELIVDIQYGPLEAIPRAIEKTWDMSALTLRVLWKMITGEAALSNISGPITIAKYAGVTAKIGLNTFIGFLAIISVSLGVLNLLPIPMLDGGHLFFYLIEAIKGSPVSATFEAVGQQIGIAILAGLMFLAIYNDIQRLMQ